MNRILRNKCFFCLLFSCLYQLSNAQHPGDTLYVHGLDTLWTLALKNNPTQKVYRLKSEQNLYNYQASKSYRWPALSGDFNGQDNLKLPVTPVPGTLLGQPGKTINVQFGTNYAFTGGLTLSKSILDWQSIFGARVARKNILLNELQQAAYEQNLKEEVAGDFFSALIASTSVIHSQKDLLLADSLVTLARNRLTEGTGDSSAVITALINYHNIEQNIAFSQQLYEQNLSNLKNLIGAKPNVILRLDNELRPELPEKNGPGTLGPDKNLEVYSLNSVLADIQRKQQEASFYPKLTLQGYYGEQQYRKDLGLSFDNGAWASSEYLGFNLSIPLFSGFENANKYRSARVQQTISRVQWEDAVAQSKINDEQLLASYYHYLKAAQASQTNIFLYAQNLWLSRQKFDEGLTDISVYFKAFQDYLDSENTHLNNLLKLFSSEASLLSRN